MIILINKSKWRSSFDVVKKIRSTLERWTKVWHAWTLDPWATWVLVLGTWLDTKKLWDIQKNDKEYITEIDFSTITDTWDMQYWEKIEKLDVSSLKIPTIADIKLKLDLLVPEYELPLPAFSAKKIKWKKSYDLARWGNILERTQLMKVFSYEVLDYNFPFLKLKLTVWSWTYIRSIWYWLWKELGLWWTLSSLERTRVWDYLISNSKTIDEYLKFIDK